NIRILFGGMQQFFVEKLKIFFNPGSVARYLLHLKDIRRRLKQEKPLRRTGRRFYSCFCTTTPAHSSKTRIAEQKSSSPHPRAIVACNICSVSAVAGNGTFIALAVSRAKPKSLCIHFVAKFVRKSRAMT